MLTAIQLSQFQAISANLQTLVKPNSEASQLPTEFTLSQNFPNPFNPTTKIKFGIPKKTFTKLEIFNVLGQSVRTLISNELDPSFYEFQWNGTSNSGKQVSSGVYFYRIEAGDFVKTRKMLFLK